MTVTVTLEGEGISFEREVDEGTALQIMEISMDGGTVRADSGDESADVPEPEEEGEAAGGLPSNFFNRLSSRQEAYVRVLLDDGGWVSNEEVRERMQADYDADTDGPQAIAGVRAGFTRKYGDEFDLDQRRWRDELDQNQYRLNPDYIDELEEGLAQLEE